VTSYLSRIARSIGVVLLIATLTAGLAAVAKDVARIFGG
jgi:hypothetical protein